MTREGEDDEAVGEETYSLSSVNSFSFSKSLFSKPAKDSGDEKERVWRFAMLKLPGIIADSVPTAIAACGLAFF